MGGGGLFEEGDYLNISVKGGDYLREVINRGTAIIRGNTVKASLVFSNYYLRALFFTLKKGSCFVFLDEDLISNFTCFHFALFFVCGW